MKLKFTLISAFICLICVPFLAKGQWCGTSSDNSFQWRIETTASNFLIIVHPLSEDVIPVIFYPKTGFGGGFGLIKQASGDFTVSIGRPAPANVVDDVSFTFNFLYEKTGFRGDSEIFTYTAGQNCSSSNNVVPTVSVSPLIGPFTSPATINITASANDDDGTITKVEFYNGTTKIGEKTTIPYTISWADVQPGNYSITAKATDDNFATTTSNPVSIIVGGQFTNEWCGESAGAAVPSDGNEFQWRAETAENGDVVVSFRGIGVATGCDLAIVANYGQMIFNEVTGIHTLTIANPGASLALSFTYRRGTASSNTGENNSNANPISYTTGSQCAISTLPVNLTEFNTKLLPNGTVSLNWSTSSENDNNYFLIEKSVDGISFTELTKTYSKNSNSNSRLDYQFTDNNPASGVNYYRLSQYDNNGKSQLLGIKEQRVSLSKLSGLYPNPLQGSSFNIVLNDSSNNSASVSVNTLAGQEIFRDEIKASSEIVEVKLPFIPAKGIYIVKAGAQSFKLIVE